MNARLRIGVGESARDLALVFAGVEAQLSGRLASIPAEACASDGYCKAR